MKLSYRPEIDGLRAIAVVSVIIYHAQIFFFNQKIFEGGFIGVDIFFVISGYLITSLIYKELITSGTFSFKYFYERRVRRILPVLIFVILVSIPFAWLYLLPQSLINFSTKCIFWNPLHNVTIVFTRKDVKNWTEDDVSTHLLIQWLFFPVMTFYSFVNSYKLNNESLLSET